MLRCEAGVTPGRDPRARRAARLVPAGRAGHALGVGRRRDRQRHPRQEPPPRRHASGAHVTRLELLRSSGERIVCAPEDAAVPGDGRRPGAHRADPLGRDPPQARARRRASRWSGSGSPDLDGFFDLAAEDDALRIHRGLGGLPRARARGWVAGSTCAATTRPSTDHRASPLDATRLRVPVEAPAGLINRLTLRRVQRGLLPAPARRAAAGDGPVRPVLLPARRRRRTGPGSTGPAGSFSTSASCPDAPGAGPDPALFERISRSGEPAVAGGAQAVRCGALARLAVVPPARASPWPWTFAVRGGRTLALLDELDAVVRDAGRRGLPGQGRPHERRRAFRRSSPRPRPIRGSPGPQVLLLLLAAGACRLTRPAACSSSAPPRRSRRKPPRVYAAYGARLFLTGRNPERLEAVAADLRVRGAAAVETAVLDVTDRRRAAEVDRRGLGGVRRPRRRPARPRRAPRPGRGARPARTRRAAALEVNFVSAVALLTPLANRFEGARGADASPSSRRWRATGAGRATTSTAPPRAGSTGSSRACGTGCSTPGVAVVTLKPGFVDTPMTAGLPQGPLFASARRAGRAIHRAIERRRDVAYIPWFWRPIMAVVAIAAGARVQAPAPLTARARESRPVVTAPLHQEHHAPASADHSPSLLPRSPRHSSRQTSAPSPATRVARALDAQGAARPSRVPGRRRARRARARHARREDSPPSTSRPSSSAWASSRRATAGPISSACRSSR